MTRILFAPWALVWSSVVWLKLLPGHLKTSVLLFKKGTKIQKFHMYLRCNVPWPNCFQLQIVQRQSYQAWKFGHKDRPWQSPWCQAPSPKGWHVERICLQRLRCSKHWYVPIGGQRFQHSFQWVQFHVHQKWSPRTAKSKKIVHLAFEQFLNFCSNFKICIV